MSTARFEWLPRGVEEDHKKIPANTSVEMCPDAPDTTIRVMLCPAIDMMWGFSEISKTSLILANTRLFIDVSGVLARKLIVYNPSGGAAECCVKVFLSAES